MIWEGSKDPIFPATDTMNEYKGIFEALNVTDTWKIYNVEKGMGHEVI
jgi:hypothetical protein